MFFPSLTKNSISFLPDTWPIQTNNNKNNKFLIMIIIIILIDNLFTVG